ncbi:hypothetical protein EDE08_11896 [Bradyrhizobium sp. R2.2-H]|jgi:hypothetical protein|uniref:hypothetical protein n=1 Tax=unclassified Bradyrhizobium TaxID=2631580 RepID=UPI001043A743|nr:MULTISPECIES: hypothetical protein [unclassified Bradyrhizobium]TCU63751.1 hypothetical protein EDE10_11835 [Bradyrhizobium sp. Y-H1]TCU65737.1 hypothetical protein EDE08_11896 [Bradyrhizobium sp. R2.2-H]
MSFRALERLSKAELLSFLVSRYDADPVARSNAALSRFIDEILEGADLDWRPSPRRLCRALQRRGDPKRNMTLVLGNDSRVPPADDGEALP